MGSEEYVKVKKSELEDLVEEKVQERLKNRKSPESQEKSDNKMSRRSFLKKLGAGMIGFGALGISSASALNIRSNDLQFYGGSGESNVEFEVGKDGKVQVKNQLNMNSHKIIGLADPTSDYHAATKNYVDNNAGTSDPLTFNDSDGDGSKFSITEDSSTGDLEVRHGGSPRFELAQNGDLTIEGELTENASL